MKITLILMIMLGALFSLGCGEDVESESRNPLTIGSLKWQEIPDAAPAAPQMQVPEGTPTVKSVGYYSDWKLTEALSGTVAPEKTIFIKIVFSEPMKFKPADDNTARPILYYRVGKEQTRFKVAKHGASGEDFVSGDAKPLGGSTDDYICKYIVPADARGKFRVEIGKFNADLDGNNLPAFYMHTEQLQLGQATVAEPTQATVPEETQKQTTQPTDTGVETSADDSTKKPTQPADTTPPTVVSITHRNDRTGAAIAEGETVPAGTTINTEVVFSESVKPAIIYATGGKERLYTLSPRGGVHWRGLCKPVDKNETTWLCKQSALGDSFLVTITVDTVDRAGNTLVESVTTPEMAVIKPVVIQQPEPVQQPVDTAPKEPTEPEPSIFATDDPHLQKAIEVIKRAWVRYLGIKDGLVERALKIKEETGSYPWEWVNGEINKIYIEETGVDYFTVDFCLTDLTEIYRITHPQDSERIRSGNFSTRGMSVEYLRLYFTHPDKTKNELLELFYQSCKAGKISIEKGQFF